MFVFILAVINVLVGICNIIMTVRLEKKRREYVRKLNAVENEWNRARVALIHARQGGEVKRG